MKRFMSCGMRSCWRQRPVLAQQAKPAAGAGDYPNKSIRLVVPSAPGGGTDIIARLIAQGLTDTLGPDRRGGQSRRRGRHRRHDDRGQAIRA